jgi:ABC-type Fe3+-hydroxamate transport system substrate-binding protein
MLSHAGFENIFAHESRYPVTSIEEIIDKKPDVVMLSSEPYPFSQQHLEELQPLFPNSKLILVDGSMFSWYGSRLQHAPGYFRELRERLARLS